MSSKKKEWSIEEQNKLFELHNQIGNKWAVIAKKLNDKNDSSIKNKFYSTLRKGLRKLNKYVTNIKKKQNPNQFKGFKKLQQLFLLKLIAVADKNYDQKYEVKQKAIQLSEKIQNQIIKIARSEKQYQNNQNNQYDFQEQLLCNINEFNKNCKKRKGKKKYIINKLEENYESDQYQQQIENNQQEIIEQSKKQQYRDQYAELIKQDSPKLHEASTRYHQNNILNFKSQILQFRKNDHLNESIQLSNLFMPSVLNNSYQYKQFISTIPQTHSTQSFNIDDLMRSHGNFSQSHNSWLLQNNIPSNINNLNKNMENVMTDPSIQSVKIINNPILDKSMNMFNVPFNQNHTTQNLELENKLKQKQLNHQAKLVQKMPNIPSPGTYIIQTNAEYCHKKQITVVLDGSGSLSYSGSLKYSGSLSQKGLQKDFINYYNLQPSFSQDKNTMIFRENYRKQYHFQPLNYSSLTRQQILQQNNQNQIQQQKQQ